MKQKETPEIIPEGNELDSLYRDQDGELPDMTKLDVKKSSTSRGIIAGIIAMLALLTAAAWAGFLFFNKSGSFTSSNVDMEIKAPFTVISGEETTYEIKLKNNEPVSLQDGKLAVTLPYGFFIKDSNYQYQKDVPDPSRPTNNYIWNLPVIFSGQEVTVNLKGQLIGEKGFKPILTATFRYHPEGVTSNFEKTASFSTEISDSIISVTADYKDQIIQDEPAEILIQVKNTSETEEMDNLKLSLVIPPAMQSPELTVEADGKYVKLSDDLIKQFTQDSEIALSNMPAQQILKFKLAGKFQIADSGQQTVNIRVSAQDSHSDYQLQAEESAAIQVVNGEIMADLIINGSADNKAVSLGDTLSYLIRLKNNSKTTLGEITVRIVISSSAVDWSTLSDSNKGTVSGSEINWTPAQVTGLAEMLPDAEIQIPFTIKLKPYVAFAPGTFPSPVTSYFEATINKIESLATTKKVESKTITNAFNSDTAFTSQARYFDQDGTAVGSGPIPPQVGQKTVYQIVWTIKNTVNELNNLSVKADLPDNVAFEDNGQAEAGSLNFGGRTVTWTVNRMPKSVASLKATFLVSVTPKSTDLNKLMTLIKESTLTATDKETGGTISIIAAPQNTNLTGDANAQGKGLVQPAE